MRRTSAFQFLRTASWLQAGGFRAPKQRRAPITSTGEAHGKISQLSHKRMVGVVIVCGVAGYLGGKMMPLDEDQVLRPQFDYEEIQSQMKQTFEFRPDLAATMVRAAFLLAARRAKVDGDFIGQSCATDGGFVDVANVLQFQTIANRISTEDLTALAAIEAIRFLRGPADKIPFHWGRQDISAREVNASDEIVEKKEKPATVTFNVKKEKSAVEDATSTQGLSLTMPQVLRALHKEMTVPEMVALMACHGVGEYHADVSGIEDFPHRCALSRAAKYTLDNHYFSTLLQLEKQWEPWEVPKSAMNKSKRSPKMMRAFFTKPSTATSTTGSSEGADKKEKSKEKRVMLVVTEREVQELLRVNPEWRQWTVTFAQDKSKWEEHFSSGMVKLLEGNIENRLHKYTPRSEYNPENRAEKEKKRLEAAIATLSDSSQSATASSVGVKKAPMKLSS